MHTRTVGVPLRPSAHRFHALAVAVFAVGAASDAQTVTDRVWIGLAGGDWSTGSNWSENNVPDTEIERPWFFGTGATNSATIGGGSLRLFGINVGQGGGGDASIGAAILSRSGAEPLSIALADGIPGVSNPESLLGGDLTLNGL